MKRLLWCVLGILSVALCSRCAQAETKVETVYEGLNNPWGVAIQPETGTIFVADSGNLKVVRIVNGKAEDVIIGFTKDVYGKDPAFEISSLGLAFIDKDTLVVGGGGKPDGEEQLLVFAIPASGQPAITADKPKIPAMTLPAKEGLKGEGNFFGVAVTKSAIYVTANGDGAKGWVAKADINGTKIENFARFIATKEAVDVDVPVGITISPRGEVVIGQMGKMDVPEDGLVTFYNAKTGVKLLNLKSHLHDITALAYSPQGQLYALDFAWLDNAKGGLFQLVAEKKAGEQSLKSIKLAALDKPTAMAFGPDGSLYVTVIGTKQSGENKPAGKLLKIAPGL